MSRVTAALYDTDNTTWIMDLPSSKARSWSDRANQVGSGSITIPWIAGTERDAMQRGRFVRLYVDGSPVWTGRIRERKQDSVTAGEEGTMMRTISLLGTLSEWSKCILYPQFGVDSFPTQTVRRFGWMSAEGAVNPSWIASTFVRPMFDDNVPTAYPDIFCERIWSRGLGGGLPAGGTSYFRYDFALFVESTMAIFMSAADRFDLYINGADAMTGDKFPASSSDRTWRAAPRLKAGNHCLGVRVSHNNSSDAWMGMSMFYVTGLTGKLNGGTFYSRTGYVDRTINEDIFPWMSQDYPADPGGVTVGKIILTIFYEARDRGRLLDWSLDFDEYVDSNGNAWDNISEVGLGIGSSYTDILEKLCATYCDISVQPYGKVLEAYRWREKGNYHTTPAGVKYESALYGGVTPGRESNILQLTHEEHPDG